MRAAWNSSVTWVHGVDPSQNLESFHNVSGSVSLPSYCFCPTHSRPIIPVLSFLSWQTGLSLLRELFHCCFKRFSLWLRSQPHPKAFKPYNRFAKPIPLASGFLKPWQPRLHQKRAPLAVLILARYDNTWQRFGLRAKDLFFVWQLEQWYD